MKNKPLANEKALLLAIAQFLVIPTFGICFYVDSSCQALFLCFLKSSHLILCNSIAGMVPV